jgi:hypothetical protein
LVQPKIPPECRLAKGQNESPDGGVDVNRDIPSAGVFRFDKQVINLLDRVDLAGKRRS